MQQQLRGASTSLCNLLGLVSRLVKNSDIIRATPASSQLSVCRSLILQTTTRLYSIASIMNASKISQMIIQMSNPSRISNQPSFTSSLASVDLEQLHHSMSLIAFNCSSRAHLGIHKGLLEASQQRWSTHQIRLTRLCMRCMNITQIASSIVCILITSSTATNPTMVSTAQSTTTSMGHLQCHLFQFVLLVRQTIRTVHRSSGSTLRTYIQRWCIASQPESKSHQISKDSLRRTESHQQISCVAIQTSKWILMLVLVAKTNQQRLLVWAPQALSSLTETIAAHLPIMATTCIVLIPTTTSVTNTRKFIHTEMCRVFSHSSCIAPSKTVIMGIASQLSIKTRSSSKLRNTWYTRIRLAQYNSSSHPISDSWRRMKSVSMHQCYARDSLASTNLVEPCLVYHKVRLAL